MNDFYPLPVSSNFRLFQYTIQTGEFNQCKVVWPGCFLKQSETLEAKHVFILQRPNSEYVFCFWSYDKRQPSILQSDHYGVLKKSKAKVKPILVQGPRRVAALALLPSDAARQMVRLEVQLSRRWLRPRHLPQAFKALQANLEETKAKHEVQALEALRQEQLDPQLLQEVHHQL